MKKFIRYIYTGFFAACILGFFLMFRMAPSPEQLILGEWEELSWEYEKTDIGNLELKTEASEEVKELIGKGLIIHQAEIWHFIPGGKLRLIGGNTEKQVTWRIKGRGHILQLRYADSTVENYNLTGLSTEQMRLNFETEVHARGIAKLTFKKRQ